MESSQLLIFDLDDTIFETRSIGQHHVASILDTFKASISSCFRTDEVDLIISDLWKYPFDHVSEKYNLDNPIKKQFSNSINGLEYKLELKAFGDFELVRNIETKKILVTTGFKKLQLAKISALKLQDVFEEIYIDEIDSTDRIHKKGIFEQLVNSYEEEQFNYFVIGDNPQSELKAGYELGLTTVQVAKFSQPRSPYATYYIENFRDLVQILGKNNRKFGGN